MDDGVCGSVLKLSSFLSLFLCFCLGVEASQVRRVVVGQDDESKTYLEDSAEFDLMFKVNSGVEVVSDLKGSHLAQIVQFDVENRRGVKLPCNKLRVGDLLLEPLYLIGPGKKGKVESLPNGHVLEESDLIYLKSTSFRQMFDAGGVLLRSDQFQLGSTFEVYGTTYDEYNSLVFEESGFLNSKGEVIIPNGTILKEHHLAMLQLFAPYPVRVRESIELDLEFYLRVNWPDEFAPESRQFWIKRDGQPQPLLLYSYEIMEGDRPLKRIIGSDRQLICEADQPLVAAGKRNSIEALDANKDAVMLSRKGLPIRSVDPITLDANDKVVEPGELVIAPRNDGEYLRTFLVNDIDEANRMMVDNKYSFARKLGGEKESFPFLAYLTHYVVPFFKTCVSGCDRRLDISNDVMKGKSHCKDCGRDVHYAPLVYGQVPSYTFIDEIWSKKEIVCAVCENSFTLASAHALAGEENDMVEHGLLHENMVHPSRLRSIRLPRGTALAKDVIYYKNGKEMVIAEGTLIDDDLRMVLEARATSPIYLSTPSQNQLEGAQCPQCFGWNAKPRHSDQLKGRLGVDEIRRGVASFPYVEGRMNRIDLICFGLSDRREPVSGRRLAKMITFRRYGDEHFRNLQGWKKVSEKWTYLPRYQYEKGYTLPVPLQSGAAELNSKNLFGDDDF